MICFPEEVDTMEEVYRTIQVAMKLDKRMRFARELFLPDETARVKAEREAAAAAAAAKAKDDEEAAELEARLAELYASVYVPTATQAVCLRDCPQAGLSVCGTVCLCA